MRLKIAAAMICLALSAPAYASSYSLTVAGTSDLWLAGMGVGATASSVDSAPGQSPIQVAGLSLIGGERLVFSSVTGGVLNKPGCPAICDGPDGSSLIAHIAGAENGLSSVVAPLNSLIGVFLPAVSPHLASAPSALNFGPGGLGTNFTTLAPALQQIFFIGNGRNSASQLQEFVAPAGAARLFLGTMDGFEWLNNTGSFLVEIDTLSVVSTAAAISNPEPASLLLLGTGLLALRRRKKKTS